MCVPIFRADTTRGTRIQTPHNQSLLIPRAQTLTQSFCQRKPSTVGLLMTLGERRLNPGPCAGYAAPLRTAAPAVRVTQHSKCKLATVEKPLASAAALRVHVDMISCVDVDMKLTTDLRVSSTRLQNAHGALDAILALIGLGPRWTPRRHPRGHPTQCTQQRRTTVISHVFCVTMVKSHSRR